MDGHVMGGHAHGGMVGHSAAMMGGSPPVEDGKIFVGGLSWDTTSEGLHKYFSTFGEVTDSVIMTDPETKKPRGFGFVTFKDSSIVPGVCDKQLHKHMLDSKSIDPKPATRKNSAMSGNGYAQGESGTKKVFVGGLSLDTTEEDVRQFFSAYGNVVSVDLKVDKATGRMRGFGFVEFAEAKDVEKPCTDHYVSINNKTVEIKRAEPRAASVGGGGGGAKQGPYGYPVVHQGSYGGGRSANTAATAYGGYPAQTHAMYQQQPNYNYAQYQSYGSAQYGSGASSSAQQMGSYGQDSSSFTAAARNTYPQGTEYSSQQYTPQVVAAYQQQQQQVQQQQQQQQSYGESQTSNYSFNATPQPRY